MRTSRERIIDAGIALLAERGFAETSLRNVAARAGCTTGSVTHHFADRQALLVAMLRAAHDAAARRMIEVAQRQRTARGRLKAVLQEALPLDARRLREWKVWLAFWAEAANDQALAKENAARQEEWELLLESLLLPLVRDSRARRRALEELLVLIDGLGVRLATRTGVMGSAGLAPATALLERHLASALRG